MLTALRAAKNAREDFEKIKEVKAIVLDLECRRTLCGTTSV